MTWGCLTLRLGVAVLSGRRVQRDVNIDGVNLVNVYLGSSTPPTDNIEIESFSVPEQGTEEQAITRARRSSTRITPPSSTPAMGKT